MSSSNASRNAATPHTAPSNDLIDLLRTFASGRGPHGGRLTMEDVRALSQAALVKAGAA